MPVTMARARLCVRRMRKHRRTCLTPSAAARVASCARPRVSARVRGPGPGGKDQLRERRHLLTSVILSPHNLEEKEKNEKGTHCGPREETSPLQHTRAAPRVGKSHGRPRRFGKALLTPLLSGPAPSGGEISSWVAERPADVTPGSTRAGGPQ